MRNFVLILLLMVLPASSAWSDVEPAQMFVDFRWSDEAPSMLLMKYPGVFRLLPDADPDTSFAIRRLLFVYSKPDWRNWGNHTPVALDSVVPVAKVMKLVAPDKALKALINQSMGENLDFYLTEVELVSLKQIGYRWQVVWELFPKSGGIGGVPFHYRALVSDRGKVIPPDLYVFDHCYVLSEGWTESLYSHLPLKVNPGPKQEKLTPQQIEKRGRAVMQKFLSTMKVPSGKKPVRFEFMNCRSEELPMSVGADGELQTLKIWGVYFKEVIETDEKIRENIFTVWLSEYGAVSELTLLDE